MPEIDTYSPRKVTPQNQDLLPSTHDPKTRTTYVQITLQEPEIQEAIRNYIRAQVPVQTEDELPVKIIAGRGDNGHSAQVTVSVGSVSITSPERPAAPMATFEEAAADAARRNASVTEESGEPQEVTIQEAPEAAQDPGAGAEQEAATIDSEPVREPEPESNVGAPEPAPAREPEPQTAAANTQPDAQQPQEEVKPAPKKSSLFDTPKSVPQTAAAEAAAPPPQTDPVETPEAVTVNAPAPEKPATKSIFER